MELDWSTIIDKSMLGYIGGSQDYPNNWVRQIKGTDYYCDIMGNVYSNKFNKLKKIKARLHPEGYLQVALMIEGKRKEKLIHRLVAEAFLLNTDNKPHINHKDGNKMNNHRENLEWATPSENGKHAYKIGLLTISYGEKNGRAKLTDNIVKSIFNNKKHTIKEMATLYNVSVGTIYKIKNKKTWKKIIE